MKISTALVTVLILLAGAAACNSGSHDASHHEHKDAPAIEEHALSLDDGKRWTANAETTEGVNNMIALVSTPMDMANIEAYHGLQGSFQNEFQLIFQRCTMKGEAHNQLHNFLIPLKGMIDQLGADDVETCLAAFKEIQPHLAMYKDYFE